MGEREKREEDTRAVVFSGLLSNANRRRPAEEGEDPKEKTGTRARATLSFRLTVLKERKKHRFLKPFRGFPSISCF